MQKILQCGNIRYAIGENGMLQGIRLPEEFGDTDLMAQSMALAVTLPGGRVLHTAPGRRPPEQWKSRNGADILEFADLALADGAGTPVPGFRLALRYEFFPDGTAFTDAFFLGEMEEKEEISGFELSIPLDFSRFGTVRWSYPYRPKTVDGALIQTSAPERNILPGRDQTFEHSIFPMTGFSLWQDAGPSCYAEFFMEGDNVLAGDPAANRSSIIWNGGNSPRLSWDFQTRPVRPASGPWQWRNRWGWVVVPAAQTRHHPPLPMYHYFDNFDRYPDREQLEAIAAAGVKVLILHENWRMNIQNGGQPCDPERFREVIEFAHARGIRVMVYVRGNEDSILEECADWFDHYLKRDYDGLYMDYGGPFHGMVPPDEIFQGGRILFRKHYFANRSRREYAWKDGLFYSHTGPMFSALGMTGGLCDGYVSGEGERGLLVRSRLDHAYFSMAAVCPGTMWTAAFPEYGTEVMVPFLAATGQSPHVPLGVQFPSSSLAHPPVPGIGDVCFRPLWKLWDLMQGTSDLKVFNDYNCRGVFPRSEAIGHYLMIAEDRAVCIYANFTAETQTVDPALDLVCTGIPENRERRLCLPDQRTPGKAVPFAGEAFELPPRGIGAVVFGNADFARYEAPYPDLSPAGEKYLAAVREQKRFREGLGAAPEWFLRLRVPDLQIPYEESMIVDLYDNRFLLCEMRDGRMVKLGYLGKQGFQTEETHREDFVINGQCSDWIPLRKIVGPGRHELVIRSLHRGDLYYVNTPFYSFAELELAREPGMPLYGIRFLNELEPDRSNLHFCVEIQ